MMRMNAYWKRIFSALAKIHIVDKFLIVFMMILLFQSAYNLFMNQTVTGESNSIDVIIRTSTAAIFGYFLSTNFIRHAFSGSAGNTGNGVQILPSVSGNGIQNGIGFTAPITDSDTDTMDIGNASYDENPNPNESTSSRLQIIAASLVGLFCLLVLLLLRNVAVLNADMTASASAIATVTQFRDIVSGCIGFLIGCTTSNTNQLK